MAGPIGAGMSRAAKKRAKKKQKNSTPIDASSSEPSSKSGGSIESKDSKRSKANEEVMGKVKKRQRVEEDPEFDKEEVDDSVVESEDEPELPAARQKLKKKERKHQSGEQIRPPKDCATLLELMSDPAPSAMANYTVSQKANCVLNFLLQPAGITAKEFYEEYWEQDALLIQQSSSKHRHRFDGLLSKSQIEKMTKENTMCYGRDLNVTRYELDKHGVKRRTTLDLVSSKMRSNDDGEEEPDFVEADPGVVWDQYKQGCTVRLLCPHKHSDSVHSVLHSLELEWGCMTGANAYLTPPGASQGFAPHYDDIEAFCLQLEGRKRWKVYAPLNKAETLPRQSSPDYTEEDLKDAKPVMDVVLSPGDILYMPRGWIHQACTLPDGQLKDGHSLHLTISAMQQWSWVDLMEILLPEAINAAAASETSTALRDGLPIRFLDYMGGMHENHLPDVIKRKADDNISLDSHELRTQELQENFRNEAKTRIMRVAKEAMDLLDASCDQISKQFLSARQPPRLGKEERKATNTGENSALKITPNMLVRLVRPGIARLVLEDGQAILYHCLDNSREYHGRPMSPLEFETDDGPALEQLLRTTDPQWICVQDLFHDSIEDKVGVTQSLFDEGLLMVRE